MLVILLLFVIFILTLLLFASLFVIYKDRCKEKEIAKPKTVLPPYRKRVPIKKKAVVVNEPVKDGKFNIFNKKGNLQLYDSCNGDDECDEGLVCNTSKMYRLKAKGGEDGEDLPTNLIESMVQQFEVDYLDSKKLSIKSILDMGDSIVILLTNHELFMIDNRGPSLVSLDKKVSCIACESNILYLLSNNSIFSVDMSTYSSAKWKLDLMVEFPTDITFISSPVDQSIMFMANDKYMYEVRGSIIQMKKVMTGKRIYGHTEKQYAVVGNNGKSTLYPSGRVIDTPDGITITKSGKVHLITDSKLFDKMALISDEPVLISKQVCVPKGKKIQIVY